MCVKLLRNSQFLYQHSIIFLMPKYAVAVGRTVGIYDTYEECKAQILNFPNAKFKKFDTVKEAEEYIVMFGKPQTSTSNCGAVGSHLRIENMNRPELFRVKKQVKDISLGDIYEKLCCFEEKLDKFVSSTTISLENLNNRISNLESAHCTPSSNKPNKSVKRKFEEVEGTETDESLFIRNVDGVVIAYTDGACVKNGKSGAMAGIGVWFNHGHPLNISAPVKGPATNNNAEIQAARVAINQAAKAGLKKLCIYTDSQFLIKCITEWINKWKKNNWKLVNGDNVKNKVELLKLDSALQELESVEWTHVKGHQGIEGNEMADKLARGGAALYQTNVTYSDFSDL